MHLMNRVIFLRPLVGVFLGLSVLGLTLAASAVEFTPPKRSIPGRREGLGTRGPACVQSLPMLTVLLPQTNIGFTTSEYPQFYWYVPKTRAKLLKFALYKGGDSDVDRETIYETILDTPKNPGIVRLPLPKEASVPPLEVDQEYYWTVTLLCNPDNPINDVYAGGWIQRVKMETALTNQLSKVKPDDRVKFYAQNGIWFDTVTALADLRCTHPKDSSLVRSWAQLLKSVKLDKIAQQPLNQKCSR
jgi:hypothetical protein